MTKRKKAAIGAALGAAGISAILYISLAPSSSPVRLDADVIEATSCQVADVQAALNLAMDGDTVRIPAGTCRWTTLVTWTAPPNVSVIGAGELTATGGPQQTIIVDEYSNNSPVWKITTNPIGTFRFAGIWMKGGTLMGNPEKTHGLVEWNGTSAQFRVDHSRFSTNTYVTTSGIASATKLYGCLRGVMDHNVYDSNGAYVVDWGGCDPGGEGDATWNAPTNFGGSDFLFFEDNVVNPINQYGSANDGYHAAKWVVRYNVLNGASVQTHPTGGSNRARGVRATEFYGNTLNANPFGEQFNAFFLSSGPSLMWGNTGAAGAYKHFVTLHAMRRDSATYPQQPTPSGWGYCGTAFNGTGSRWDENANAVTGKRCLDQPGNGQGDLLSGAFPNVVNKTSGCGPTAACAWPRQAVEGVYEWLNTLSTNNVFWSVNAKSAEVLTANSEYWLHNGNTSCNPGAASCTGGVGAGTRAQRPVGCTPGVAWWAVDQGGDWHKLNSTANDGTLDKCVTPNVWKDGVYTPYQYPHPLVSGGSTPPPPPPPPSEICGNGIDDDKDGQVDEGCTSPPPPPPPSDTTPPTVTLSVRRSGGSSNYTATISASDNVKVKQAVLYADTTQRGSPCTLFPCEVPFRLTTSGSHTVVAVALDTSNNTNSAKVMVQR